MKALAISLLLIAAPALGLAQAATPAAKPGVKAPAAKSAAGKRTSKAPPAVQANRARRAAAFKALTPGQRQAIEVLTPLEEPDPAIQLDERHLAVATRVHVGEIPCELGAQVEIKAFKRPGFFLVKHRATRFVMHPVYSRTGAIRLEDPVRGALWLQLGNKSMLMNQKEGKRLADECQSPEQVAFANEMKTRPAVNILEPEKPAAPAAGPASAAASTAPVAAPAAPETVALPVMPAAVPAAPVVPETPATAPAPAASGWGAPPAAAPAPTQ